MKKTWLIRQLLITVGFIPGLWIAIGIDPQAQVAYVIIDQIAKYISSVAIGSQVNISFWGTTLFNITGIISTFFSWWLVYNTGGGWGVLATIAVFFGGVFIQIFGIYLFIAAFIIALFLPLNEEYLL